MPWVKQITTFALCLTLVGCSGYTRYNKSDFAEWPPSNDSKNTPLNLGDSVVVHTTKGIEYNGVVESMDETVIVVAGQSILFDDIELIQVRSTLWAPTAVLAVTAVAASLVFLTPEPTISVDNVSK